MKKTISLILILTIMLIPLGAANVSATKGGIIAKGYILMEAATGKILASGNEHVSLPIASTTKIMTALLALEQPNIFENFEVDSKAIMVEGTSMGLRAGDKASLFTLANGMLLPSGNDAANAAAVKIAGSIPKFSDLMNKKAASLSMNDSHFVTPSGLHDENHYSSAYDMALLTRAALKNPTFASICSKSRARVEFGNPLQKRQLSNHNRLLVECEGCIGVKTGFTKKAGRCLVSATTRDDVTLICVTLGAADDWNVHKTLYDTWFPQIEKTPINVSVDKLKLNVVGGTQNKIGVATHVTTTAPVQQNEVKLLKQQIYINRFYYAPIKKGDVVGEIKHYLNDYEVASTILVANQDVALTPFIEKKKTFFSKLKEFFSNIF
ncbi:D-alanyl-D-alanine carboxypeptidase family protein [Paludicola sp. MB14-C6]|uniref:D-alanyl-D-alanine carboxypeptidase family protein n=1 Tax=Paludihabitans sp. MB14-C6 TaxID=3070656 RepID=UPI0027DC556B|nr:D-alanyl-D-alanine carboxypeptidase family protein [Paludicola sp. MB14-C6]WMJ22239.1 D-alanyl-D-alanine carboxypeptidase family protein [Paludicola sp. MB14-C6]